MLTTLATGAAIGVCLLLAETILVALIDGPWSSLSAAPVVGWAIGAIGGALAGALLSRGGADRMAPRLIFGGAAAMVLVQVNHRWLPDALEPRSLAVTLAICVALLLAARLAGGAVGSLARRGLVGGAGRPMAVLATTALVAVILMRSSAAPVPRVELWSPHAEAALFDESSAGEGSRRLLLLGIDGGRWETIDPLIEAGKMPNLAALIARGRRGILASSVRSASPVVWTTIMTGQPPEVHGITDWDVAISTNRRVRPLWGILADHSLRAFVENVPGTFPADRHGAGMLAGFPMPQGSRSNGGWLATTVGPTDPLGPMHIDLVEVGDPSQLIELIDLPSPFVFEKTTPYLVLRRFSEPLALIIARTWCGRVYARFEIDQKSTEGVPRIGLSSEGTELCSLSEGEWGPWLSVEVDGQSCLLRPHATRVDGEETTLFFTALFRDDGAGISWPPGLAGALQQEGRPYVAEGTGWRIFYEPTVLGSLEEHQRDLGAARLAVAEELLTSAPWDAFVHIFTLTDRVQHPFWKFREPDLYARIPELYPEYASPEPYELHAPSEEAVRDFGGAVDRAYESVDGWLGRVLAHAADSTLIVVVSDHGGQGGPHELSPTAGIHHEDGIYLMVGPTVPPREDGERELSTPMEQTDVVPLVLAHLRLPSARDLPGGVPEDLMPRAADGALLALPEPVETYEIETSGQESAGEIDEAIRDQLRSLGYVK